MTVNNNNDKEERKSPNGADKATNSTQHDLLGSDMYPERRGGKAQSSWYKKMLGFSGREATDNVRCEDSVYRCIQNSPAVKLMLNALKSSGCEFDIRRHISCEVCLPLVTGGYDSELNQIVICQNSNNTETTVQSVLIHELVHMFDYCRNKLDMRNIDHLACTEIRAANLANCSFISSVIQGDSSFINIKATHQDCVKTKAKLSVMAIHQVSAEVASAAIERVFTKCYNDLEPMGRRIRRNSDDMPKAYAESFLYGYGS